MAHRKAWLATASAAATFISNAAFAQVAAEQSEQSENPEIVVTAQFREQSLQDTPLAITAIDSASLDARSQTSIVDLGGFAPNVNLTQGNENSPNAVSAFIRGIGQEDASFALEPGVGIYVDDVYYGTTFGSVIELADLDRVEVLRGPQGTLAGKNSLGGAVKLFSRRPNAEDGGFIEATYGSFNRVDVRGSANFKLSDALFARFSGVHTQRDGYLKLLDYGCVNPGQGVASTVGGDCVTGTMGGTNVSALRGAIRYAPDDSGLEINLSADVARTRNEHVAVKLLYADTTALAPLAFRTYTPFNPFAGVPYDSRFLTGPNAYSSYENFSGSGNYTTVFGIPSQVAPGTFPDAPRADADSFGVSLIVDYRFSEALSIKSITAWREAEGTGLVSGGGSPITIVKQLNINSHKQFTQELRLSGKFGTLADVTVGGFYYLANDRNRSRTMIPSVLYDFASNDPSRNRSIAAFGQVELHLTDALNVIGGIRYTHDRKRFSFSRTNVDGSQILPFFGAPNFLLASLNGVSDTFEGSRVDYRIGVNYRFNDSLMAYAQVSTGYKGGGINPRPFVADQVQPFLPETLTTYEGGFKADLFDRTLRLNAAGFYNSYGNIQRLIYFCPNSSNNQCSQTVNAGKGHSMGFELEASARPVRGLSIEGSVGYLDFKYDEINPFTSITIDMTAPFHSKWTASAGIQYEAELGGSGTLTPRLDWSYQSSFYYMAVNSPLSLVAGRSLFNARLTYQNPNREWSISASVTNLTNKFYYFGRNDASPNVGTANGLVGRPREWAVTVRRTF